MGTRVRVHDEKVDGVGSDIENAESHLLRLGAATRLSPEHPRA